MTETNYTPALGSRIFTCQYDAVLALLTRERRWRGEILRCLAPKPGELIVDVGCGTGTMLILVRREAPAVRVIGIDPDAEILAIAAAKAQAANVSVEWRTGMGDRVAEIIGEQIADKAMSSLVLHQCPLPMKRAILAGMFAMLRPGGQLVIADYSLQRNALMRLCFRLVQMADGKADTQPNADGILPSLIGEAGFVNLIEAALIPTLTGSISIYTARRP